MSVEFREFTLIGGTNKVCLSREFIAFVLEPVVAGDPTMIFCTGCSPLAIADDYPGIVKWLRDNDLSSLQELN